MVSSNQLNSVRVSEFETRKEGDGLDAEQPPVDIIAFKIARGGGESAEEKLIRQVGRNLPKNR